MDGPTVCIRDMLIKDASDVSNYCEENAFPSLGISVFVLDIPCVLNTSLNCIFILNDTLLDRFHGA